jgi:antirestriction protein ArdC
MAKTKRRLSEPEREQRRAQDRERLRVAAQELLSSEGWQRWVRARALFHSYSLRNCMLLAQQCHERGIDATRVAGFRTWLKLGRCVRKGEKGLVVLAPMPLKQRAGEDDDGDERRVVFRSAFVFADSQTNPLPDVEPAPLEPPREPLTGDSHHHLLERLQAFAASIDFAVRIEQVDGSAGGWCDPGNRRIVVDAGLPANAQVRVLVHELTHALGVGYEQFGRARAEVVVDTVTFVVCSAVGLAVDGESIPYVAGWGEDGALDAVMEFAETIDTLARRLEDALADPAEASTQAAAA